MPNSAILFVFLLVVLCLSIESFSVMRDGAAIRNSGRSLTMGNNAKFGIFSPVVYGAKFVLGELRGKAIALHSQAITEWCLQYGAYNLRLKLIKKAKKNGDELGFLV